MDAFIPPKILDYFSPNQLVALRLNFLDVLIIAESDFLSDAPVYLLLGVDIFMHLLESGLRKSIDAKLMSSRRRGQLENPRNFSEFIRDLRSNPNFITVVPGYVGRGIHI